jgi:hypothetical protein
MAKVAEPKELKRKKLTQKEQSERFRETARQLGCDETEGALDRAFKKIIPKRKVMAPLGE